VLPRESDYRIPPARFAALYRRGIVRQLEQRRDVLVNDPLAARWEIDFLGSCSPEALVVYEGAIRFETRPEPLPKLLALTTAAIHRATEEIRAAERTLWPETAVADFIQQRLQRSPAEALAR